MSKRKKKGSRGRGNRKPSPRDIAVLARREETREQFLKAVQFKKGWEDCDMWVLPNKMARADQDKNVPLRTHLADEAVRVWAAAKL